YLSIYLLILLYSLRFFYFNLFFCFFFFFFFQAEDGIRDRNVTGVQTCALPISVIDFKTAGSDYEEHEAALSDQLTAYALAEPERSEERRVGKECRSGGGRDD